MNRDVGSEHNIYIYIYIYIERERERERQRQRQRQRRSVNELRREYLICTPALPFLTNLFIKMGL